MTFQTTTPEHVRRAALALLRRGQANLSEVAELAGVSRQLVRHWAAREEVDWQAARSARLQRYWERAKPRPGG